MTDARCVWLTAEQRDLDSYELGDLIDELWDAAPADPAAHVLAVVRGDQDLRDDEREWLLDTIHSVLRALGMPDVDATQSTSGGSA